MERWLLQPLRRVAGGGLESRFGEVEAGQGSSEARPAVLFVLHQTTGGIPLNTSDLARGLRDGWRCFVLEAQISAFRLLRLDEAGGCWSPVATTWFRQPWMPDGRRSRERAEAYREILRRTGVDVVHVRHLLGQTPDLLDACQQAGVPAIFSFHDYYTACPSIHLLDREGRHCRGDCSGDGSQCSVAETYWLRDTEVFGEAGLDGWRRSSAEVLRRFAGFVVPSRAAADLLVRAFPFLAEADLRVVEHGRDFDGQQDLAEAPEPGGPIRILVPGNLASHKGSEFIRRLVDVDRAAGQRLEFHFAGEIRRRLGDLGRHHGRYRREQLFEVIERVRPAFVGVFSVWPETYCHVVTEAWAAGVPVVATDLGAPAERIRAHGGGWVLPVDDVEAAYRELLRASDDPDGYREQKARATVVGLPNRREMADRYAELYREVSGR